MFTQCGLYVDCILIVFTELHGWDVDVKSFVGVVNAVCSTTR